MPVPDMTEIMHAATRVVNNVTYLQVHVVLVRGVVSRSL